MRLAAEFRRRWRSWAALSLLIAVFGGATAATAAAARRTDTAYQRLLAVSDPFDMFILTDSYPGFAHLGAKDLLGLPDVTKAMTGGFFAGGVLPAGVRFDPSTFGQTTAFGLWGTDDPSFGSTFNTGHVVAGRLPDPARPDEVAVPVSIAPQLDARPGMTLHARFVNPETNALVRSYDFHVAGIVAAPGQFPPYGNLGPPPIQVTPAFYTQSHLPTGEFTLVKLRGGAADLPNFRKELTQLAHGQPVLGYTQAAMTKNVVRAFGLQADTLFLLALFLAIVTALVLGQALGRDAMSEAGEHPTLRALGMTRRDLIGLGALRVAVVVGVGAALTIPVAYLLSPLAPTGLARAAEPQPGLRFDAAILLGFAAGSALLLWLLAAIPVVRAARVRSSEADAESAGLKPSAITSAAARAGAPVPSVIGARFALEPGRGSTSVPVRTTIAGIVLSVAALTMSLTFGASLNYFVHTPRLYGVTWQAQFSSTENPPSQKADAEIRARALSDPDVRSVIPAALGLPLIIDKLQADTFAIGTTDPGMVPMALHGRLPRAANEILFAPKTFKAIGKPIGSNVDISIVGIKPARFTLVGEGVLPTVGHTGNLGEGAYVTMEGAARMVPHDLGSNPTGDYVVLFKPEVDPEAARARLTRAEGALIQGVEPPMTPGDLVNFGRDRNLPWVLSGLLALLAAATLVHSLITSILRRRRDLAVLKTLGFARGQVASAIAWQASIMVTVSLLIGVPLGAAVGRWLWNSYATGLGILPAPRVPLAAVMLVVPAAIVIANLFAALPARAAARTRPALVLRTE